MWGRLKAPLLTVVALGCLAGTAPARAQSASHGMMQNHQPSEAQIQRFCRNYDQLSGAQRKQYRHEYQRYCEFDPTFGRPVEPEQQPVQPQQPAQQQPQQQPEPEPAEPEVEPEPEPEIQPAEPEPAIEPEPLRVDLAGALRLDGPLARRAGERQGFRVEIQNRGKDPVQSGRLWARVFLSERDVSRRQLARAFSLPAVQQGQRVRIPGVPGPGQTREVMARVTLPAAIEAGQYWWCVLIDERGVIEETDEGNNIACARKVVAIGQDQGDSELSGLFGANVDELKSQSGEDGLPGTRPTHSGLLRQAELDRMAAMLTKTGGASYDIFTGQSGASLTGETKRGLLLMRNPGDLIPLGGDYYEDGRGNMVIFGEFASGNGDAPYALTLFAGGGLQLMVDIDRDGVIDAGVSEGLKDRFGFLARPGMEQILDCMKQAVSGGAGPAGTLPGCLGGASSDEDGSGGGAAGGDSGGGLGSHLDGALQPQCGSEGGIGSPVGFSQPADDGTEQPEKRLHEAAEAHRENAEHHRDAEERARERGDTEDAHRHQQTARDEQRLADMADQSAADWEFADRVAEDESSTDEEKAEAYEIAQQSLGAYKRARDNRSPAPGPGGTRPAGVSDPRCEEPSMWTTLHSERCASNMADCLKRMSDPIYAKTGGRCETVRGPDDAERIECRGNDSVAQCIENGGDPTECAERHAGDGGGVATGEDDEIFEDDRGTLSYGVMDVHPFGATLAAMCRKAGGIGPCGDPAPAMEGAQ